jgi:hypothetical protein
VQPHEPLPVEITLEHLCSRDQEFQHWLDQLRDADPTFARASALQRADWGEWQAAVYLLTGCWQAWTALGPDVVTTGSIAPVIDELERHRRGWSSGEQAVLRWTAHFWDTGLSEVGFPCSLDEQHFYRWITACHLYKHTTPLGYSNRGAR